VEFRVFKNGKAVNDFPLSGAYLFGTDGIAIRRARILSKGGVVSCMKPNMQTAGLALLWPVEGFGSVLLPTTCLPEKNTRYNLNLEIARGKLMQIVNKREDWSYFDHLDGLDDAFNTARDLFIRALQKISDPPAAAKLADESLEKALDFSEQLALRQAESLLRMRGRNRGFGRRCLGCVIDPERMTDSNYLAAVLDCFPFVTIPATWAQIEPQKGKYNFSLLDSAIQVLSKKRVAICVGPLLRFTEPCLPRWLLAPRTSYEKIREAAYRFVGRTVARYAGSVHTWRIIAGLNAFNHFGFSFEQTLEMTRAATMAARAAGNRGVRIVELSNPWGEYYADTPSTIPPLVYMDMVVQSGINFDAFGLALRFGKNNPGMHIRDMLQISAVLDYFGAVGKPLYVTEVEVPAANHDQAAMAGLWRGPWDPQRQGLWLEQFYKVALSKPFIDTVSYAHFVDTENSELAHSGLFDAQLKPKPAIEALHKLQEQVFKK